MRSPRLLLVAAGALALLACTTEPEAPGSRWASTYEERLTGHPQRHNLSCEARAAVDLLAAHKIRVKEDDFLARLPHSSNPNEGFVGDVDGDPGELPPAGYGVHGAPIAATLRAFGLDARVERGRDIAWLRAEVEAGRPVIVWVTAGCRRGVRTEHLDARGKTFGAVRFEHVLLAIGDRDGRIRFLDPASGQVSETPDSTLDAAWSLFGREAVSATGPFPAARTDSGASPTR